jgi:hypothetical protein
LVGEVIPLVEESLTGLETLAPKPPLLLVVAFGAPQSIVSSGRLMVVVVVMCWLAQLTKQRPAA